MYSGKLTYNDDGTIFKKPEWYSLHKKLLPVFEKYELDFLPKVLSYDDTGYTYRYVDGVTIRYAIDTGIFELNQYVILEMKMAMDDIWKKFYQISIENRDDEIFGGNGFLYHGDPWLGNVIWNDDTKEFKFIDIDSLSIAEFVPLTQLNNMFFQHLETLLVIQNKNQSTLGTWI